MRDCGSPGQKKKNKICHNLSNKRTTPLMEKHFTNEKAKSILISRFMMFVIV